MTRREKVDAARNPNTPTDALIALSNDKDGYVREAAIEAEKSRARWVKI
jgi:hypothetical protein